MVSIDNDTYSNIDFTQLNMKNIMSKLLKKKVNSTEVPIVISRTNAQAYCIYANCMLFSCSKYSFCSSTSPLRLCASLPHSRWDSLQQVPITLSLLGLSSLRCIVVSSRHLFRVWSERLTTFHLLTSFLHPSTPGHLSATSCLSNGYQIDLCFICASIAVKMDYSTEVLLKSN